MKSLPPIVVKDTWHRPLQARVSKILAELYAPVLEALDEKENAKVDPVTGALKAGVITYRAGVFRGKFSAAVSRQIKAWGGVFKGGAWHLDATRLPPGVALAATAAESKMRRLLDKLALKAEEIAGKVTERVRGFDFTAEVTALTDDVEYAFRETVTKKLGVQPRLDSIQAEALRAQYTENVGLSIKGFADDETLKLRADLKDMVYRGAGRVEVARYIEGRLGVARERAKFIARQETALYTSKLKEGQYRGAGIETYRWETVGDIRVRPRHKHLNRRTFKWAEPPVIDLATGRRGHPGEDFNCRCQAAPLVPVLENAGPEWVSQRSYKGRLIDIYRDGAYREKGTVYVAHVGSKRTAGHKRPEDALREAMQTIDGGTQ